MQTLYFASLFASAGILGIMASSLADDPKSKVTGKRVAILATDGVEQSELMEPKKALEAAGVKTTIVSLKAGSIKAWSGSEWGNSFKVDATIDEVQPMQFDALVLPGGVISPDKLRMDAKAVAFVKEFAESGKPIAAICHGPWTLVEANAVRGKKLTSWPSLRTDIKNAGGVWEDSEVVVDGSLVTSRKPDDIPAFNRAFIELLGKTASSSTSGTKP